MDCCVKVDGLLHGYGGHEVIHGTILLLMILFGHEEFPSRYCMSLEKQTGTVNNLVASLSAVPLTITVDGVGLIKPFKHHSVAVYLWGIKLRPTPYC